MAEAKPTRTLPLAVAKFLTRKERGKGSIYVGGLVQSTRAEDLKALFQGYGPILRCDIKYAYAFIDFEVKDDAVDCIKFENGRKINGQKIIVDWAKEARKEGWRTDQNEDEECFRCLRRGHMPMDCPELRWRKRVYRGPPCPRPSKLRKPSKDGETANQSTDGCQTSSRDEA